MFRKFFEKKRQEQKKEDKEEYADLKEEIERKVIASSYINPELTASFTSSIAKQLEELQIMVHLLRKQKELKQAEKIAEKLRSFADGKSQLQLLYALTVLRVEIETSGFLESKILTPEEMLKNLARQ
jgi:regulator of PEP synthase PpsR (kinase-PPPase family)